jgi:fructuronate reductase
VNRLSRSQSAPPVRHVHLGLGNFFRAHQAWYTEHAGDAAEWGIAAFTGRSPDLATALAAQDGLYTLVTRAADGDRFELVRSVSRPHAADDQGALLGYLADPEVRIVSTTVT